jgi:hypothetical protein
LCAEGVPLRRNQEVKTGVGEARWQGGECMHMPKLQPLL